MKKDKIKEKYMRLAEEEKENIWRTFFGNLCKLNVPIETSPYWKYSSEEPLTLREAIIAKCVDCRANVWDHKVDRCPNDECPLYAVMSKTNFFEM
jgi:hypothetical protein